MYAITYGPVQCAEDAFGRGYVHWKSWQETYARLIPAQELARQTLEKCQEIARAYPQNTLIAKTDGRVVGFACWSEQDGYATVEALYVLKEFQGLGIGKMLLKLAMQELGAREEYALWVLGGNESAIGFYEHHGFRFDGAEKQLRVGLARRMILTK